MTLMCLTALIVVGATAVLEVAAFWLFFRRVLPVHEGHLAAIREAWETLVAVTQPLAVKLDGLSARMDALERRAS